MQGKLSYTSLARLWANWPLWGGLLAALLVSWHTWELFAPEELAVPNGVAVVDGRDSGRLFGSTGGHAQASPINGVSVIGIFARRDSGFAVLQTPQGQIGLAVGNELMPGVRLVETHANHVVVERAGTRHTIEMSNPPPGVTPHVGAPTSTAVPPSGIERLTPEQQNLFMKQIGKGVP